MRLLLALVALALPADSGEGLPLALWNKHTSRMEGAAVSAREAAAAVRATAEGIASAGRVQNVATLHSQALELNRKVVSARMAAGVLDQPE